MSNRKIGVKLHDPNNILKTSIFLPSSFFHFDKNNKTSFYTFTTDENCEDENCVLITSIFKDNFKSNIKAVILPYFNDIKTSIPTFYWDYKLIFNINNFTLSTFEQKTNFLFSHIYDLDASIPYTIDEDSKRKSCYTIIEFDNSSKSWFQLLECIANNSIPIIVNKLEVFIPFYHYEATEMNLIDTINTLSPRSYFYYDAPNTLSNRFELIRNSNQMDNLFYKMSEYILKRKVVEIVEHRNV